MISISERLNPALLATLLVAGGCSYFGQSPEPMPVPFEAPTPLRVDTVTVEVDPPEMVQMERRIAVLQLQLLEQLRFQFLLHEHLRLLQWRR